MTNREKLIEIISSLKDDGLKEIAYSRNVGEKSFCEILADRLVAAGVIIPEPLTFPTWDEADEVLHDTSRSITGEARWAMERNPVTSDLHAESANDMKEFAYTAEGYSAACAWIEEQRLADLRKLAGGGE